MVTDERPNDGTLDEEEQGAAYWVQQFGHSITDNEGGYIRMKGGNVYERFLPVEGGFHFFRVEQVLNDEGRVEPRWVQKPHHYETGEPILDSVGNQIGRQAAEPIWLWPEDNVLLRYKGAVQRMRAAAAQPIEDASEAEPE
jgi:hypothetical protein